LTIYFSYVKIFLTRAIAQLVEHLVYTCANAFQRSLLCNEHDESYWKINVLLHIFEKTGEQ